MASEGSGNGAGRLAALVYPGDMAHGDAADALVLEFCLGLRRAGWRVGGLAQRRLPAEGGGKPRLQLVDVRTGHAFPISQNLGPLSRACSLDTGGIAQASGVLRQALADRVQLAVTNRFGELEATGGGYAAELGLFAGAGIPVLTVAAHKHLEAWRRFTGGMGEELPLHLSALNGWFGRVASAPSPVHDR